MVIHVDNLSKSFDYYKKETGIRNSVKNLFHREKLTKDAVKKVSFDINEGEIVAFLGPNGAGKTTTLKMLSGILYPTNGSAEVLGYTPWERKNDFKKQFSIVMGQKNQLWLDLPASDSLHLNKCIYEIGDRNYKDTLEELVTLMDVKHLLHVQVRRLSLGERMKMELIAALLHKPRIIFLDEPTIGLDLISQKNIREFLKHYNNEFRTTILLTSHYMKDIEDLCKRTIVINQGKLVYDGEIRKINEVMNEKKLMKMTFSTIVHQQDLAAMGTIKEYNGYDVILEVERGKFKDYSRMAMDHFPVIDLNIEDIPLEEAIARLYEKADLANE
ncbi:ATP-binding cassette domain-containing protein [Paenibacillus sp. sgz500958]|uniref:ABC transporter ATP-binding protein n=1 Tax=Paenibacillus sp. sgz500958 TaxID=3242475 RepID=UPI0036D333D0